MAPDEQRVDRLQQVDSADSATATSGHEKPNERAATSDEMMRRQKPLTTAAAAAAATTATELKRPIVNGGGGTVGQKINKYGACESSSSSSPSSNQLSKPKSDRPRTLSNYIVGKNWSNFGGQEEEKENSTQGAETQRGKGPAGCDQDGKPKRTRLERVAKCVPGLGIIMSLCASLFLGTAGMLVKLTMSVHGIEVAVLRALIQLLIYAAIIGGRGIRWLPRRNELYPVMLRAFLGGLSITLSYSALKLIPLGDATTIRFSLPIWTLIMSYFFLRESCSSFKIFAVVISISGVLLVTKPDLCVMLLHRGLNVLHMESDAALNGHELAYERLRLEELAYLVEAPLSGDDEAVSSLVSVAPPTSLASNITFDELATNATTTTSTNDAEITMVAAAAAATGPLTYSTDTMRQFQGCLMALGSSICLSISIIALRLCKQTASEVSIFWLSLFSIAVGTLTLAAMGEWSVPDNWRDVLYILLNGACGAMGQWFMTNALKVEQSGVIALARTFDIEVAFLYSAFLLGEDIRMTSILGSVLVSLGVVSVVVPKWLGCGPSETDDDDNEDDDRERQVSSDHSADSTSASSDTENHLTTMTNSTSAGGDTIGHRHTSAGSARGSLSMLGGNGR